MKDRLKFEHALDFKIYEDIENGADSNIDSARHIHSLLIKKMGDTPLPRKLENALNLLSQEISDILGNDFKTILRDSEGKKLKFKGVQAVNTENVKRLLRYELTNKFTLRFQALRLCAWYEYGEANKSSFDMFLLEEDHGIRIVSNPTPEQRVNIILGGISREVEIQPVSYRVMVGDYSVTIDAVQTDDMGYPSAYIIKSIDNQVLTKNLEWVSMRLRSNRDSDFVEKCYFDTLDSARSVIKELLISNTQECQDLVSQYIKLPSN